MRARLHNYSFGFMTTAIAVGTFAALTGFGWKSASAQSQSVAASVAGGHTVTNTVERMELIVKTSRILSLGDRIPRFQVHNEEILGATPVSENQIQLFAKLPGSTQVNLWDTEDKLYTIDVTISADAREVEGILNSQLPLASLKVMPINDSAIVSGYVTSVDDVDRAVAIIEQFYKVVINNIEVVGVQQVLLHTRIMEVSRTKLRSLGIDWSFRQGDATIVNGVGGLLNVKAGGSVIGGSTNGFTTGANDTNVQVAVGSNFNSFVEALAEQKLIKTLAEPTVVATHGRPARFTVGGRVPNITVGGNGQIQVSYEDYGTSIDFLPFVVGPGRIRLEVRPEVSEPDPSRAVVLNGQTVQAFTQRYVETAVEMQAGQTFVLAGLLQTRVESSARRVPFLGSLPYIGSAFRKVRSQQNEIELLIMVTPELVDAMDPHEVPAGGPGTNSDIPDEHEFYFDGYIEVPNLKGDHCNEAPGDYCPSDTSFQGGTLIDEGSIIVPGGLGRTDGRQMPQRVAQDAGTQPGNRMKPATTVAQNRSNPPTNQQVNYQPSYSTAAKPRSRVESGTLIPNGAVRPGEQPTTVGEGVTITQPSYR